MTISKWISGWTAALVLAAGSAFAQPQPPEPMQMMLDLRGGSFLGIGVGEVDADRVKELKLKEERGVEVTMVETDSPAAKAGMQKGDVVLEYHGQRVEGASQFIRMVRETPAGRAVKLLISRNGATQTLTATVAERKAKSWTSNGNNVFVMPRINMPDIPRPVMSWRAQALGIEAESLEGPLAQFFGVKNGVLVRRVSEGSAAEKAGLKAGDVIVKVGDASVDSPQDISNALRNRGDKKSMALTVVREKKEMTMNATFEDNSGETPKRRTPARTAREYRF